MKKQLLVSIVMGALFLGWGCQRRATSGRRVNPPSQSRGGGAEATVAVIFSTGDREIIIEFARGKRSGLPPGLAKKDRLPPGLERQLRRNAQLPPGLQKRLTPFPSALEAELGRRSAARLPRQPRPHPERRQPHPGYFSLPVAQRALPVISPVESDTLRNTHPCWARMGRPLTFTLQFCTEARALPASRLAFYRHSTIK